MDAITLELYEALKAMSQSYDITVRTTPCGWIQQFDIAFQTAKPQAEAALVKFEQLKVRESAEYMTNILRFDPHAASQSS
jgi:hypothetical protein